jgi:two-component system cell cycle sensor histidine kinase/response regulator CckA
MSQPPEREEMEREIAALRCEVAELRRRQDDEALAMGISFKRLLDDFPAQIAIFDPELRYVYLNLTSIRDPELRAWAIGRNDEEYFLHRGRDPEGARRRNYWRRRSIEERKPLSFEEEMIDASGERRHFLRWHNPIFDSDGNLLRLIGYGLELTEQRKVEQQLLQAQKLEAVGQLAGGIAHDFNNLLTAINGYCELLELRMKATDPLRDWVGEIRRAGAQATSLTSQLLAFSRKQKLQLQNIDLHGVLDEMAKLLRRTLGEHIEVVVEQTSEPAWILIDPGQIRQVILNLAVNARDAMAEGGHLRLSTRRVKRTASDEVRPFVELAVADDGSGMEPQIAEQIFQPFFTTKPAGKGTGLGLSTVYGIVKQSGGDIEVESQPGRGTTFRLYFTEAASPSAARHMPRELMEELESGWETILVVEDEQVVRELAENLLTFLGYNVLVAVNGRDALQVCARHPEPIHLVLSDVVMPELNGPEMALRLIPKYPEMKWIFMSGYTRDADPSAILGRRVPFVQKPFKPVELGRLIRSVLES